MMPKHDSHPENREPIFTPLIKKLQQDSCMNPKKIIDEILNAIKPILRGKMKEKGLWNLPPRLLKRSKWLNKNEYLWNKWEDSDAFHELLDDCYMYVIHKRIQKLRVRLKEQENIDGYVRINIDHFLFDLRRNGDRAGYNVAMNTRAAVNCAEDNGCITLKGLRRKKVYYRKLKQVELRKEVYNQTRLILVESHSENEAIPLEENIRQALQQNDKWNEVLSKLGGTGKGVQEHLCEIICEIVNNLKKSGINYLSFKDLVDVMKDEVRAFNPTPKKVPIDNVDKDQDNKVQIFDNPDEIPDEYYECWCKWRDDMRKAISQLDKKNYQDRVRKRLYQVFIEQAKVVEKQVFENPEEHLPTQAELAEQLGVSVGTINNDMQILRQIKDKIELGDYKPALLEPMIRWTLKEVRHRQG